MKFGQFIDFYLRTENKHHWDQIVMLSTQNTLKADEILEKFILESARLCGPPGLIRNVEPADGNPIELVIDRQGHRKVLKKGDRVSTSFVYPRILERVSQVNRGKSSSSTQVEILQYSRNRKIPPPDTDPKANANSTSTEIR